MGKSITIDTSKCNGCMLCSKVCFINYEPGEDGRPHTLEVPMMCAACGHCVAICPAGAIIHPAVDLSSIEQLDEDNRPSYDQFLGFLKMRRSRREFKDQDVPREVIDKLIGAANQAPNGLNRQNVSYTVITDRALLSKISMRIIEGMGRFMKILGNPLGRFFFKICMKNTYKEIEFFLPLINVISKVEGRDMVMYNAPCLIMIYTPKHDACGAEDAVYCGANILLAAETLGLGACVIGFVSGTANGDPGIRKLAKIPAGAKVQTAIVLGYPEFRYTKSVPKMKPNVDYIGS